MSACGRSVFRMCSCRNTVRPDAYSGGPGADGRRGQGGVGHREASAQGVDGAPDRAQYLGQLIGAEPGEATGGGQQVQPLIARVEPLPVESPLLDITELSGLPDLVRALRVDRLIGVERPT